MPLRSLLPFRPRPPGTGASGLAAASHRLSYRLHNSRFASSPAPGQTIATLLHLVAEPAWVRLVYVNDGPEPWTVDGAAVATTAGLGDGYAPIDALSRVAPSAWRPITFRAQGRDSEPEFGDAGGPLELTVPGTAENGIPRHVLSDWIPLRALPRTDGGHGWLLHVRTFSRGAMRFAASGGLPDPAIPLLHRGFVAAGNRTGGDDAGGPAVRQDTACACHGIQYVTPTPGATVIGIGDSIIHSSCTTGEVSGFGIRACTMISEESFPVSYVSEGFPGRNSRGFGSAGRWAIETLRPQVAILSPWSQNEEWTSAMADVAFARMVALMDAARRVNCSPIVITAAPVFAAHPACDAIRRATNDRVRALGRVGVAVLDIDALWGTGTTPNSYRRDYDAGDHTHPNDRACAAAARLLAPMLRRLLGRA